METLVYAVREEEGFEESFTFLLNSARVDITGWSFALQLRRQAGTAADIDLGNAEDATSDGVWLITPAQGDFNIRIGAAAFAGVEDTTGDFTLYGVLYGTEPGETEHPLAELQFIVTKGPGA